MRPAAPKRAVKTIKGLLQKSGDAYKALLAYRATPTRTGYSPSELLMGRLLRSTVPTTRSQRQPRLIDPESVRRKDEVNKERQKRNFDSNRGARQLPPLESGDLVLLPDKEVEGEVVEEVAPQSYMVDSPDGTYRRNRKDIICLPNTQLNESGDNTADAQRDESGNNTASTMTSATVRRSSRCSHPPERLDPSWAN